MSAGLGVAAEKVKQLGNSAIADSEIARIPEEPRNYAHAGAAPLGTAPAPTVAELVAELVTRPLHNPSTGPFRPVSTPDEVAAAAAFFERIKAAESADQKSRASRLHGRVFSVMQFLQNAKTGETMYSQEQLDTGLDALRERGVLQHHAYIWQTKDRYNEKGAKQRRDKGYGNVQPGDFVPSHVHLAVLLKSGFDYKVRQISDLFEIPASRVRTAGEALEDKAPKGGPGAAKRSFLDLVTYMTHERLWGDHSQLDGIPSWERGSDVSGD